MWDRHRDAVAVKGIDTRAQALREARARIKADAPLLTDVA